MSDVEPLLRVVRGSPTADELAALVTVVLAARARPAGTPAPRRSAWLDAGRPGAFRAGLPVRRDRHSWRASALPR